MLPALLGNSNPNAVLSGDVVSVLPTIEVYLVENLRSARRYLKLLDKHINIDALTFFEIGKHSDFAKFPSYLQPVFGGKNAAVLSEAGCPGIADPGSELVKIAHEKGIQVVPIVGPSSLLLALISSGFNGQQFHFHGYLPIDGQERKKALTTMEANVQGSGTTHFFIETPFRNEKLLHALLANLNNKTKLCIACDITLPSEFIKTKTVASWKKQIPQINKRPTVFLIGK